MRHGPELADLEVRRGGRTDGDPRGDRDARRRAGRPDPRPVRRDPVAVASPRQAGAGDPGDHRLGGPRSGRPVLPAAVSTGEVRGRGGREPEARRGLPARRGRAGDGTPRVGGYRQHARRPDRGRAPHGLGLDGRPQAADRAGPPVPGNQRVFPPPPGPIRLRRGERRAGGRHVVAAVPGDPGEARPGLLRVQLPLDVRRDRPLRRPTRSSASSAGSWATSPAVGSRPRSSNGRRGT